MRRLFLAAVAALVFMPSITAVPATPTAEASALMDPAHWTATGVGELLREVAKVEEGLDPEDSRTLAHAGHIRLRAGVNDQAAALFERAQKSDPKVDEAFLQIAMAYSERKAWAEADKWFALAVALDPKDLDHLVEWGVST